MFVLISMYFSWLFKIWSWNSTILTFFTKFNTFLTCRLQTPAAWKALEVQWTRPSTGRSLGDVVTMSLLIPIESFWRRCFILMLVAAGICTFPWMLHYVKFILSDTLFCSLYITCLVNMSTLFFRRKGNLLWMLLSISCLLHFTNVSKVIRDWLRL